MRCVDPKSPVTIELDGEKVVAARGEPVAAALLGAGKIALARSAKFHRPRGPACLRGACDGCLARVNEVPNVMTCLVPAEEGLVVETQNILGSREVDLLRMTDWFFPEGMNHHELFAGVPGVQGVMQVFARRVAGLGRLPKEGLAARGAVRRDADVLVVGAGPAGMAAAVELARRGRRVEVVDDALQAGGGVRALGRGNQEAWRGIVAPFEEGVARKAIICRTSTTAAGFYGDDVLVASEATGAEVVNARTVVLAPGAHDGAATFEGNDLPGVMSSRAAGWLLAHGVVPAERVVVACLEGGGPFGEAFARAALAMRAPCEVEVVRGAPSKVSGSARVKAVYFGKTKHVAGALLVDAPRAPAYELSAQAGATLVHEPRGFVVKNDAGKIRDGLWAVGEVTGAPFDPGVFQEQAKAIE